MKKSETDNANNEQKEKKPIAWSIFYAVCSNIMLGTIIYSTAIKDPSKAFIPCILIWLLIEIAGYFFQKSLQFWAVIKDLLLNATPLLLVTGFLYFTALSDTTNDNKTALQNFLFDNFPLFFILIFMVVTIGVMGVTAWLLAGLFDKHILSKVLTWAKQRKADEEEPEVIEAGNTEPKWKIRYNYLKGEKKLFKSFFTYLFIYTALVMAFSLAYWLLRIKNVSPEVDVWKVPLQLKEFVETSTKTKIGFNLFSGIVFLATIYGLWKAILRFLIKGYRNHIDLAFMNPQELALIDLKRMISGGIALFLAYFLVDGSNLFNLVGTEDGGNIPKWIIALIVFGIMGVLIAVNFFSVNREGRGNIIAYLQTLIIVLAIVAYPVKEYNWGWILTYSIGFTVLSVRMMWSFGKIYFDKVTCYVDEEESGKQLYILYRLDSDRVVCSYDSEITDNSELKLYPIQSICNSAVKIEKNDKNKEWLEVIKQIEDIDKVTKQKKAKAKADKKAAKEERKTEKAKEIAKRKRKKKIDRIKDFCKMRINHKKITRENDSLKKQVKELQEKVKKGA